MNNIVNVYTDYIAKEFCFYAKEIMGKYYIASIFEKIVKEYILIRYYNIYPAKQNNKTTINYYLNLKIKELVEENPNKIKNITFMVEIFNYLIYLDSEIEANDVNKIEKELSELIAKYELYQEIEFSKKYREFRKNKKDFFKAYETEDFVLEMKNMSNKIYDVKLNHNIKMPELYSEKAIEAAYNSGLINEDKLFVLYNLVGITILKDILECNYTTCYMVDFNVDLFDKKEKLNRLFKIIDNDITKEKLYLKVTYSLFNEKRDEIFDLINNGYNFALIKDKNYKENDYTNLFKYVLDSEV